jgi:hypothetical protein
MSGKAIPSFVEFRRCVLAAYAPAIRDMGFAELRQPRGGANEFAVRLGNATTTIEVEGINWGTAAWTKVFRASDAGVVHDAPPIDKLLQLRQGLSAKEVERVRKRRRKQLDQLADVRDAATAILEYARDVLLGDFSQLDEIAEQERHLRHEKLKKALPSAQKATVVAASMAGHAFKRGDYRKVVELLEPHLPYLSPAEQKRLAIAKKVTTSTA